MKRPGKMIVLVILLFLLFGIVIITEKIQPAGCFHLSNILTGSGGCNDNAKILALKINPEIDCLNIEASDCAYPSGLSVQNLCKEPVYINGNRADIKQSLSGNYTWGEYIPEHTQKSLFRKYYLNGTVGNQSFTISYVNTGPLCN